MIQWVQGVWFLIILRAFYIKMSRVASRIYALLLVIRQQMSPFFSSLAATGNGEGSMLASAGAAGPRGRSPNTQHTPLLCHHPLPVTNRSLLVGFPTQKEILLFRVYN